MEREQTIDPIWQVFKVGLGFFGTGVVVQFAVSLFAPQGMALTTLSGVRSATVAQSALNISNWAMGLGAVITVVACTFFCVRAIHRTP